MSVVLKDKLESLKSQHGVLASISRGLEKEGLRVAANGKIAQTDHPRNLGSALTHSAITTDYSEALLELITSVHTDPEKLLQDLAESHTFVHAEMSADEAIWAGSMPCAVQGEESIRIAHYGESNSGRLKHIYRIGLAHRYGRIMQSIAGLHYNFSLDNRFWLALQDCYAASPSSQKSDNNEFLQRYKTENYFGLIRNFRRWSWLLMYLFGASPVFHESFLDGKSHRMQKITDDALGLPYATSLRMSDLGYQNNAQASLKICFNHLHTYIDTLFKAMHTPYPKYQQLGVMKNGEYQQLNTNLLQIENEYYNTIRPKRVTQSGEKPLQALDRRGVEYIEVRCLDLNPFLPLAIDSSQIKFLDAFLLTCLLADSPLVSDDECLILEENFNRTVENGRSPNCRLLDNAQQARQEDISIADAGQRILDQVMTVAAALDDVMPVAEIDKTPSHVEVVSSMRCRLLQPETTPSARLLAAVVENGSYLDCLLKLSQQHKSTFLKSPLSREALQIAHQRCEHSWIEERSLRERDRRSFAEYLEDFLED